jgi:ferredoxin
VTGGTSEAGEAGEAGGTFAVSIDTSRCAGHGRCYEIAPSVFEDDDAGYGTVRTATVVGDDLAAARQAELACPEQAIRLEARP